MEITFMLISFESHVLHVLCDKHLEYAFGSMLEKAN